MKLTTSYQTAVPRQIRERYEFRETRNAAAILGATNDRLFVEILEVLDGFSLTAGDLLLAGGNEGYVARRINHEFRDRNWREARVDSTTKHALVISPYRPAGEFRPWTVHSEPVGFSGYKADWVKERVAGDVEWNAKDGNLDRNLASYRALYDSGFIDAAVLITRTQDDLRELERGLIENLLRSPVEEAAKNLETTKQFVATVVERILDARRKEGLPEGVASRGESRLGTSTTTNLPRLEDRLRRGDAGGCPVLAVGISAKTWDRSTPDSPRPW